MSTRSQIGFYEFPKLPANTDTLVYKHSDGYPEGVLPLLTEFCKDFAKYRGLDDTEYATARYIGALVKSYEDLRLKWSKEDNSMAEYYKKPDYLGIGVGYGIHGDIEFFYSVSPTKIQVYECHYTENTDKWTLKEEIDLIS